MDREPLLVVRIADYQQEIAWPILDASGALQSGKKC